jgi:SpoIID/LytB domain protein
MPLIDAEPVIHVGVLEGVRSLSVNLHGLFDVGGKAAASGEVRVDPGEGGPLLRNVEGKELARGSEIACRSTQNAPFLLRDVVIGVRFHWERKEDQVFQGNLLIRQRSDGSLVAINEIGLEDYLKSVISSEMSASCPAELLRAHAITSRSWLVAMLMREQQDHVRPAGDAVTAASDEIVRWYTREDHDLFDVCADDHCQRYQGISKIISSVVSDAVDATRGQFLVYEDEICDARFYKACGGLTEDFRTAWENVDVPYLRTVSDAPVTFSSIRSEEDAAMWLTSKPEAYCNTHDVEILRRILPSFDQETVDFFRWTVTYEREELEEIIRTKAGMDLGTLRELVPLERGPSGRLTRLRIGGSKKTVVIGKELEIRRWLSRSHLYSSAFVVETERSMHGDVLRFVLRGGGWGHGVGLCQIGAAVMAVRGASANDIVTHYFRGAVLKKLY